MAIEDYGAGDNNPSRDSQFPSEPFESSSTAEDAVTVGTHHVDDVISASAHTEPTTEAPTPTTPACIDVAPDESISMDDLLTETVHQVDQDSAAFIHQMETDPALWSISEKMSIGCELVQSYVGTEMEYIRILQGKESQAVRSEDVETATTAVTTDVRLMHEEDDPLRASSSHLLPDDAVVQGGPEEGPAHLDFILGSDSDILISLGAKPHQPLNATFPQRVFTRIGGLDREGNEVNSEPSQYRFQCSWFQRWPWLHYLEATDRSRAIIVPKQTL
ncbi:hypothetical protein EMCRGX_G023295 [Ephydatia muelleri]|eukprot:Em0017g384a